jgi:hypothetical protein
MTLDQIQDEIHRVWLREAQNIQHLPGKRRQAIVMSLMALQQAIRSLDTAQKWRRVEAKRYVRELQAEKAWTEQLRRGI